MSDQSLDFEDIGHNVAIRVRDMPEGTPYGVDVDVTAGGADKPVFEAPE